MARDYARKPARRQSRRKRGRGRLLAALLLLLAILGFLAYLAMEGGGSRTPEKGRQEHPATPPAVRPGQDDKPVDAQGEKEHFWFYDLLRKKTVEVPEAPDALPKEGQPARRYVMQCGSFRDEERADSLKAQLALVGFEARIVPTKEKGGETWFRVVLGPYDSRRKAESDRHQLQDNGINRCQIW
jgi:cell division protein FtsN